MISVEIDKLLPSEHGVAVGCIIRYGDGGPVRFVQGYIPVDLFDAECRLALLKMWDEMLIREPEDDPLW